MRELRVVLVRLSVQRLCIVCLVVELGLPLFVSCCEMRIEACDDAAAVQCDDELL